MHAFLNAMSCVLPLLDSVQLRSGLQTGCKENGTFIAEPHIFAQHHTCRRRRWRTALRRRWSTGCGWKGVSSSACCPACCRCAFCAFAYFVKITFVYFLIHCLLIDVITSIRCYASRHRKLSSVVVPYRLMPVCHRRHFYLFIIHRSNIRTCAHCKQLTRNMAASTGMVFFQRFYQHHSFKTFPYDVRPFIKPSRLFPHTLTQTTAAACLFVAGKVEEEPRKLRDFIPAFFEIVQAERNLPIADTMDPAVRACPFTSSKSCHCE